MSPALRLLAGALCALAVAAVPATAGARGFKPPPLTAGAAILVEPTTHTVLYARHPDQPRAIASTTKLMTVLLALERRPLEARLEVPAYAALPAESRVGFRAGERLTVADLVRAALLPSANDAANTLAVDIGGSRGRFVALMNRMARRLRLTHTHYATPVGLDTPGNHSTARDLARLAVILRRNPFARHVMDLPRAVLRSGAHRRVVVNRNRLVAQVPWFNGVKTGHTLDAGYVLVGSATRGGMTLVSVVLGTPSEAARDADTLRLMRWGFASWRLAIPLAAGQVVRRLPVRFDPDRRVPVVARSGVRRVLRRSTRIHMAVDLPRELEGPLPRHAVVGHVTVRAGGRRLARVALLTAQAVPGPSPFARLSHGAGGIATLVAAVLAATLAGIAFRRRAARRQREMSRMRRQGRTRDVETA